MARLVNDLISLPEIKTIQIHKGPINQKYVNIGIPVGVSETHGKYWAKD